MTWEQVHAQVKQFTSAHRYEVYNIAHVVLDDHNFDNDCVTAALDRIADMAFREEYMRTFRVSQTEVDEVVEILRYLLTIPEEDRLPGDYDDEGGSI